MQVYPLKFRPIYKERIWGGRKLCEVFGRVIPEGKKIGESWELADLPDDKSEIINGPLVRETIASAIEKLGSSIIGTEDYEGPFPLLIKILDAEDILSVQVHPDAETCRRMGSGEPKTECWYIISAKAGAVIYKGLKKGVTKGQFVNAITAGNVAELLEKVEVKQGQCHFLPAGTAHAIGPGLIIAEIQTPSDTTYRVFDWNRVDKNGKARELHIAQALESIHFGPSSDSLPVTTTGRLVDCEFFKIDKYCQGKGCNVKLSAGKMKTLVFLTGHGRISGADNEKTVKFNSGDTILIPAAYDGVIRFDEDTEYLAITI